MALGGSRFAQPPVAPSRGRRLDSRQRSRRAGVGFAAEVAFDADGPVEDYLPGWRGRTP